MEWFKKLGDLILEAVAFFMALIMILCACISYVAMIASPFLVVGGVIYLFVR